MPIAPSTQPPRTATPTHKRNLIGRASIDFVLGNNSTTARRTRYIGGVGRSANSDGVVIVVQIRDLECPSQHSRSDIAAESNDARAAIRYEVPVHTPVVDLSYNNRARPICGCKRISQRNGFTNGGDVEKCIALEDVEL